MSFKTSWIIPLAGLLVGLATAACGAADTTGSSTGVNDGTDQTSATLVPIPVLAQPTASSSPKPTAVQPTKTMTTITASVEALQNFLNNTRDVEVNFDRYSQFIPRDAIKPVYEPLFLPGQSSGLDPQELVIGVAINGESKAYPAGTLTFREMINDEVGGVPILVSW